MWLDCASLLFGLFLIIKGGDLFVSAAVRLAEFLRMPRVVIGSTLVSLATTTPELAVSIMAAVKGEADLAIGNAVGSCICNIGLVFGITAALREVDIHLTSLRVPLGMMFILGVTLLLMTSDLVLDRRQGFVLVLAGLIYFIFDFYRHMRGREKEEAVDAAELERALARRLAWIHTRTGSVVQFLIAAGIVVVGSRFLVDGAVHLAAALGIPSILVGLTVVAVGTSLPELVTAVTSARKSVSDLAMGNVLGANIANLSLIAGAAALISEVRMTRLTQLFNFPAMLVMFGLLIWFMLSGRRVTRKEGIALLVFYNFYIASLVLLAAAQK